MSIYTSRIIEYLETVENKPSSMLCVYNIQKKNEQGCGRIISILSSLTRGLEFESSGYKVAFVR